MLLHSHNEENRWLCSLNKRVVKCKPGVFTNSLPEAVTLIPQL